jgi:hypothetical protein
MQLARVFIFKLGIVGMAALPRATLRAVPESGPCERRGTARVL